MSTYNDSNASIYRYIPDSLYNIRHTSLAWVVYAGHVVTVLGLVGNLSAILAILLRRLYIKSSMFIFIAFIAGCDFLFTVMLSLQNFWEYVVEKSFAYALSDNGAPTVAGNFFCKFVNYITYISSQSSVSILVCANISRLLAVLNPLGAAARNNKKIALYSSVLIILFVLFLELPTMWIYTTGEFSRYQVSADVWDVAFGCAFNSGTLTDVWVFIDSILYVVVPGFILLAISLLIAVIFMRKYRRHKELRSGEITNNDDVTPSRSDVFESARSNVVILVPLSLLHLICTVPMVSDDYYNRIMSAKYPDCNCIFPFLPWVLVNTLYSFNHALNIYVQLAVSKTFRHAVFGRP